jgi:guanosine-3',5'-bis(diphosphate) 3'-pyrophosphohydrolase
VEIVTSAHQKPSKDWLKHVKTAKARAKIRHFVLREERDRAVEMGKEAAERELKKWRIDIAQAEKGGDVLKIAEEFGFKTEDDLYASIGYGKLSAKVLITRLVPPEEREKAKAALQREKPIKTDRGAPKSGVRVQGLSDVMVNFAKCCNPLPGDQIRGYITRGRGVTIHKADCQNLLAIDSKRIIDVDWDEEQAVRRIVRLAVRAKNKVGLLASISGVFSSNDSDIVQANVQAVNEDSAHGTFMVSVKNLEHLTKIMNALKKVKGVEEVNRLGM